jgi:predicted kinase
MQLSGPPPGWVGRLGTRPDPSPLRSGARPNLRWAGCLRPDRRCTAGCHPYRYDPLTTQRFYVLVAGPPGSGKTTLARPLADALDLPLIRKDAIKEALGDALGAPDLEASQRLGPVSMRVLRSLALDIGFGVFDSPWRAALDLPDLLRLPAPVVEIFCQCDPAVRRRRILARSGHRHPVHFDAERLDAVADDDPTASPLGGPWPLLEVDTTYPVPIDDLAARVRRAIHEARPTGAD